MSVTAIIHASLPITCTAGGIGASNNISFIRASLPLPPINRGAIRASIVNARALGIAYQGTTIRCASLLRRSIFTVTGGDPLRTNSIHTPRVRAYLTIDYVPGGVAPPTKRPVKATISVSYSSFFKVTEFTAVPVQVPKAVVTIGDLIKVTSFLGRPVTDAWGARGFPRPVVSSYGYSKDAGLVRTEFRSGATRQRRRWGDGRRTVTATFNVTTAMLYAVETFINEDGYNWFTMGLITGDNSSSYPQVHVVRVKSDPKVGSMYGDNISVSLELELRD